MYTKHKTPGKFEGNESQMRAQVLHDITLNGFHDNEFGHAARGGWYALVIGKRYAFVVRESNIGFFDVIKYGKDKESIISEFEFAAERSQ